MMNEAYRTEPKNPVLWYYKNVTKYVVIAINQEIMLVQSNKPQTYIDNQYVGTNINMCFCFYQLAVQT